MIYLALIFKSLAAIFAKQAALTSIGTGLYGIVINIWLVAAIIVLFFQAVTWIFVLRRYPLSLAYPFMSLAFGLNLFAAWLIFDEMISLNHVVGIGIIILGVTILRRSRKGGLER